MPAQNEVVARDLAARLHDAGIQADVEGGGVHWQVSVRRVGSRGLVAHCFWYGRELTGLRLGMNPANARTRSRGGGVPYEGPEYLVVLQDEGRPVADGRTHHPEEVVGCAKAWLAGDGLEALAREAPFIWKKARAMRALSQRLAPGLRWEIGSDPSYELWIYGDGRSCCLIDRESGDVACRFALGQAQVGAAELAPDAALAAVEAWLLERVPVVALPRRAPGVELEPHVELLEAQPARWHWANLLDRVAGPDVLAPMRELIEALATSHVATRFYSYSSLNRLVFSASSHYPWVDQRLPVVEPAGDGAYLVRSWPQDPRTPPRSQVLGVPEAVKTIEAALRAAPIQPFFGSMPHHDLQWLSEALEKQGTPLRPRLVQRGLFYDLEVADASGARRCKVDGDSSVEFVLGGHSLLTAPWTSRDDAVRAIRRFCEDGASVDELG